MSLTSSLKTRTWRSGREQVSGLVKGAAGNYDNARSLSIKIIFGQTVALRGVPETGDSAGKRTGLVKTSARNYDHARVLFMKPIFEQTVALGGVSETGDSAGKKIDIACRQPATTKI